MISDENTYKQIQAYLDKEMSEKEALDFEVLISRNDALKEIIETYQNMDEFLGDTDWPISNNPEVLKSTLPLFRDEKTSEFSKKLEQASQNYKNTKLNTKFKTLKYGAYVAGLVLLLFFGNQFFFNNISSTNLFSKYYSVEDLPSLTLKSENNNNLADAERLFKQKKYSKALNVFTAIKGESTNFNSNISIYIALTHLHLDNHSKALTELELLEHSNTIDFHKAYWFKALVYLDENKKEEAKKTLKTLVENSMNFNYTKARKLLKQL